MDRNAKSISPMKLYGVPVGMMFCEGAPFLLASPASVLPFLPQRDPQRILVESYPKLVASKIIGRASYKTDDKAKVTPEQASARRQIVEAIRDPNGTSVIPQHYGFSISCDDNLAQSCVADPTGDTLDALLCALQAAWSWSKRNEHCGIPETVNRLEGWICDPELVEE